MQKSMIILIVITFLQLSCSHSERNDLFVDYIAANHKLYLKAWLSSHPNHRLAADSDCLNRDGVERIRKQNYGDLKPIPNYHPYYAIGDFNSDGNEDFAVAVIDDNNPNQKFTILVFNGPYDTNSKINPVFVSKPLDLSQAGLFYGGPRPKPWRLLVGLFESEGTLLMPTGNTYKWGGQ